MFSLRSILFCIFCIACISGCNSSSGNDDVVLRIMSENFYPYNYQENGTWKGLSYEVVQEILARNSRSEIVELLDWSTAMQTLEEEDNGVLFTTTLTPERKQKFKWAGPLGKIAWAFFAVDKQVPTLTSIGEASSYRVAVVQNYPMHELLLKEQHPNLVVFPSMEEAVSAVFEKRVDLIAADTVSVFFYAAAGMGDPAAVRNVYDLKTELLYIAFSKGVPDSVVGQWQKTLDDMKDERLFAEIFRKYIPHGPIPEKLQLYTEDYPPISFREADGRISGGAMDVVRGIAAKLDVPENAILTNWGNAYNLALENPRVVLFSTERTAQREDLFNWVGPIGRNSANFYTKAGSAVVVDSLESARNLKAIGTCSSWFTEQMLLDMGFTNLISVPEPKQLATMLISGEIEATVFTDITMQDIITEAGLEIENFSKQHLLTSTDFYIAISKGTESEIVSSWQSALDEMVADGTFDSIYEAWYPNAESPY